MLINRKMREGTKQPRKSNLASLLRPACFVSFRISLDMFSQYKLKW